MMAFECRHVFFPGWIAETNQCPTGALRGRVGGSYSVMRMSAYFRQTRVPGIGVEKSLTPTKNSLRFSLRLGASVMLFEIVALKHVEERPNIDTQRELLP